MENGRHKIFNFQVSTLDTILVKEKIEEGFSLQQARFCRYNRHFFLYKNNTLFEKLDLPGTEADLIGIQGKVEKFDMIEHCTQ